MSNDELPTDADADTAPQPEGHAPHREGDGPSAQGEAAVSIEELPQAAQSHRRGATRPFAESPRGDRSPQNRQVWGAPPVTSRAGRSSWTRTVVIVVVTAAVAAAGGVIVTREIVGSGSSSDANAQPSVAVNPGGPGAGDPGGPSGDSVRPTGAPGAVAGAPGGGAAGAPGGGLALQALHGEYVVSDGNGGYRTERTQTGRVTAISGTALTVASDDGFSATYVVNSSTVTGNGSDSTVTAGTKVMVTATVVGGTATAVRVLDAVLLAQGRDAPGVQGGPAGVGTASSGSTTAGSVPSAVG